MPWKSAGLEDKLPEFITLKMHTGARNKFREKFAKARKKKSRNDLLVNDMMISQENIRQVEGSTNSTEHLWSRNQEQ